MAGYRDIKADKVVQIANISLCAAAILYFLRIVIVDTGLSWSEAAAISMSIALLTPQVLILFIFIAFETLPERSFRSRMISFVLILATVGLGFAWTKLVIAAIES